MKRDKQTKENLLKAAKEEFLEKGYMKASLRNICKKADVTTGALYFFFQDKEDLFGALVEEPLHEIYAIMKAHYEEEAALSPEELLITGEVSDSLYGTRDYKASMDAIEYMYQYQEEFLLLLTKAQGSRYENCMDDFIEVSEAHYRRMAEDISQMTGKKVMDEDTLHCIVHLQMEIFTQPITHGLEKERAKKQIASMVKFLTGGWFGLWK